MKFIVSTALALMLGGLAATGPARAGSIAYEFSYSGTGVTASGIIATSSTPDGSGFDIVGISGTRNGVAFADLLGGDPGIGNHLSPSGYFYFDNVLFPTADPLVDNAGILFEIGGIEFNLYSNGPDQYVEYQNTGANVAIAFDPSLIPEPASAALLSTALAGFAWFRLHRASSARAIKPANARGNRIV